MTEDPSTSEPFVIPKSGWYQVARGLTVPADAEGLPENLPVEWRPDVTAVSSSGPFAVTFQWTQVQRHLIRDVARAFRVPRRMLRVDGPRRLCIDGHAYRRRQKARRRRKQ